MMKFLNWLSAGALVAVLVGLLIVRALISSENDTVAAIVIIALFWSVATVLLAKLLVGVVSGQNRWEYTFLLGALLAFAASAILGKQAVGHVTFIIFILSVLGVVAVWVRRRRSRRST